MIADLDRNILKIVFNSYFNREATSAKAFLQQSPVQHTHTPYKIQQ